MSDLHCPARLTLATRADSVDTASLRLAGVYASADAAALQGHSGEQYDVLEGVLPGALDDVADRHRGEDVLVLLTPEELAAMHAPGPAGAPVHVDIDADGWAFQR